MVQCLFVRLALVYTFVQSTVFVVAESPWWDGFFDAPVSESNADQLKSPPDHFRYRIIDHELGRPKRSSDTMYWDSPDSSYKNLFSSSCSDYSLWAKSAVVVMVAIVCTAALVYLVWCYRKCSSVNTEHGYYDMKCHSHCAYSSNEQ